MYFNLKFVLIKLKLVALLFASGQSYANVDNVNNPLVSPELTIFPEKCVALRQGKDCFTKLTFERSLADLSRK